MIAWTIQTLVSTTLLMLLVLAIRRPVASMFGARIAYALWALPALRMILPALPFHRQLFVPVMLAAPDEVKIGLVPPESVTRAFALPPAITASAPAAGIDWPFLLLCVWAGGALLWFAWQMGRYGLFMRRALRGATTISRECGIAVMQSDHVTGPVAAGIVSRRIFLPRDFVARYSPTERRQALLHEGAHHDRFDIVANLAALAVLAVHWWNPIAHRAYRAFRSDQELACDATVLERMGPEERYAYGSALVKSGGGRFTGTACALDRATEIKRRLKMIKRGRIAAPRRYAGALIAATAITGGLLLTASGGAAAEVAREAVKPVAAMLPAAAAAPFADPALPMQVVEHSVQEGAAIAARARAAADRAREAADHAGVAADHAAHAAHQAHLAAAAPLPPLAPLPPIAPGAPRAPVPPVPPIPPVATADEEAFGRMISAQVTASLATARAELASECARRGKPVPDTQDWSRLAMCGVDQAEIRREVAKSLAEARDEVARDRDIPSHIRKSVLASLDQEIARNR
ncbi:M56 family metallopeptidase [Sphingomonas naphthae]|uniref:M56 family metallopeptidase n=1 Tax=Sphingomonas naphthae TaxID=1813468 RepID=A0ABY7TRH1_9SPHN|nr:M56 family metallopeptidase [Sphingomonas naphthae]WCT74789.1 M56 family metallopeptidase [Sphingomonas naphthae]